MFSKKGKSFGEMSEKNSAALEEQPEAQSSGISDNLHQYVSELIDSMHGKCVTPDIVKFIERSK